MDQYKTVNSLSLRSKVDGYWIVFQAVFSSRQLFKSPVYLLAEAAQRGECPIQAKFSSSRFSTIHQSFGRARRKRVESCYCGIVCWLGWQSHFLQLGFLPRKRRSRKKRSHSVLMDRLLRLMFHASLMIGDRIDFMLVTDDSPLSITLPYLSTAFCSFAKKCFTLIDCQIHFCILQWAKNFIVRRPNQKFLCPLYSLLPHSKSTFCSLS